MSSFLKANRGLSLALVSMTAISVAAMAQTSGSPFASKKKKQAWETDSVRPSPSASSYRAPTYQAPSYVAPDAAQPAPSVPQYIPPPNYDAPQSSTSSATMTASSQTYSSPSYSAPPSSSPSSNSSSTYSAPPSYAPQKTYGTYTPQARPPASNLSAATPPAAGQGSVQPDLLPGYRPKSAAAGAYYPGRDNPTGFSVPARAPRGQMAQNYSQPSYSQNPPGGAPYQGYPPQARSSQAYPPPGYKSSWKDRFGLGNLATTFSAVLKLGAAAVQRKNTPTKTGWREGFIADGKVSGEVSAITGGGLEYGVGGELRAQYDKYRRGFGGKVGECGTGEVLNIAGCNSLTIDGVARGLRGHSSQFYSAGVDNAKAEEFALEGAYLFLRSAYGDVTIGRDDGAAYLFSLGAPTLLAVNASNSPVDYTGLDSVRTVNEASGFSEKIAYVSPRLLGDQIGLGIQFGASYAPNARACGVDYCVRSNDKDGSGALSPDLKDVIEFGVAFDRTFANGLSLEGTATYATASEDSGLVSTANASAGFDDLKSYGLGLEAKYGPWTLGGSFLNSNNGLLNGDYEAYDVGLTFKPAKWGVSASYGHATDKNVNLLSDQATLGFVYDFDRFTLGTGVQYIERDVTGLAAGLAAPRREKATALFIEGGVKF